MALPIQSAPTYSTNLPSNGRTVKYRPFLVKEQKLLIIAQESEDTKQILSAIKDLIFSVTFGEVVPDDIPTVDLEWLFIKVRSVSVGETTSVRISCTHEDCKGTGDAVVDLSAIRMDGDMPSEDPIMINDNVGIKLKLPSMSVMAKAENLEQSEQVISILKNSMVQVFDEASVYHCNELSDAELTEFVESLTFAQLALLGAFFDSAPKLTIDCQFVCNTCSKTSIKTLEGMQNFF